MKAAALTALIAALLSLAALMAEEPAARLIIDLTQLPATMKPCFVCFTGGCIVEGKDLPNTYRWKDTIGDIAERQQNWNRRQGPDGW